MEARGPTVQAGAALLGAALLVLVADVWWGPFQIAPYQVRIAGLAYVVLAFCALPYVYGRVATGVWSAAVALSLLGLPISVVRPDSVVEALPWIGAGLVLALLMLAWPRSRDEGGGLVPYRLAALITCLVAGFTIAAFQLFNQRMLAAGVPNEERSLILAGVEIHHLVWGVLLLTAGGTLGRRWQWGRVGRWVLLVLLGLGLGQLVDQWLYYARIDPSDEAYFDASTVISAWVGLGVLFVSWQLLPSRK